jgi:hypothetical protein
MLLRPANLALKFLLALVALNSLALTAFDQWEA